MLEGGFAGGDPSLLYLIKPLLLPLRALCVALFCMPVFGVFMSCVYFCVVVSLVFALCWLVIVRFCALSVVFG